MNAWHRFLSKVREVGPAYALQLAAKRVVPKWLLDVGVVYLCELDLSDALLDNRPDPEIRLANQTEFDRLTHLHGALSSMHDKSGPGVRLWVLGQGDEIDAFMWLDSQVIRPSHWVRFELAADEIAGVFLWVSPERRGRGLGPRMNRHVSHEYAAEGYGRIVSTVDAANRNSLRADEKVGYRRIGKVRVFRLFGLGGILCRGLVRFGWWTERHPLVLGIDRIEHHLRRVR